MFEFLDDVASSVGNFFSVDDGFNSNTSMSSPDAIKTGTALTDLGFFGNNEESKFSLPNSVKAFQDSNGLKVDGIINPGGPTENAISNALSQKSVSTTDPLEVSQNALPSNVTMSQPDSSKPDQKSWTASASFGPEPAQPKPKPKGKLDPLTGLPDPLASAPKGKMPTAKQWEEVAKMQKKKVKTAIVPHGNSVQQRIQSMMTDKRYSDKDDSRLRDHVVKQFEKAYPGNVQYDETGKMLQPKPVIKPEEVEVFDPDGELQTTSFQPEEAIADNAITYTVSDGTEKNAQTPTYQEEEVPILYDEKERLENIIKDEPAKFPIEKDPNTSGDEKIHEFGWMGSMAVTKHTDTIEQMAEKHNIDPDLLKSVMWAENARGHKFGGNLLGDLIKQSDSPLPMNMNKETGSKLLNKSPDEMYDAKNNIEAAAVYLKRLQDRTDNPTPEKLGSMWIYTGRNKTHDWGAFVQRIYDTKPWLDKEDEHGPERETFGP